MKTLLKKALSVFLIALILMQSGIIDAFAATTADVKTEVVSSTLNSLDKKSEELAKKLAEKGIKEAIGKIPVVGGTVNSLVGPYIKDLLGIKEGESTGAKLDKINGKLDTLLNTISSYNQNQMRKLYELTEFKDFNAQLSAVKSKTTQYLREISEREKRDTTEEDKTLLIAGLTEYGNFEKYLDDIMEISQYATGQVIQIYQDGDIYTKAYKVFCYNAWKEDECALGGEAAMLSAEYVNAINEVIDSAQTTAAILLLARCYVGYHIPEYQDWQQNHKVTSDISLAKFDKENARHYKTRYNLLKEQHYDIFGATEEDVDKEVEAYLAEHNLENNKENREEARKNVVSVKPGVVGEYNQMIEDRWFDYIQNVNFSGNIPEVIFVEIDGEIGFASVQDYGFDKNNAMSWGESSAVNNCKSISNKAIASKHNALSEEQFNKLLNHIAKSKNFKYPLKYEGADYNEISLRNALVEYGFSFADFDKSGYNSTGYSKIFVTNAKCIEDYENSYEPPTHDGYIDGVIYGIDYDTITVDMNSKSAETKHQYFKGSYSDHRADKRSTEFPEFVMLYFQNTISINSVREFKDFIESIGIKGNNYANKTVVLNCDVDLSEINYLKLWPDANRKNEFCGTFDGNGHIIENFHISAGEHRLALFRTTGEGAVIKALTFENVDLECTGNMCGCAAVVGYANGSLTLNSVIVNSGSISGYKYVGGLVGETKEGKNSITTISNSRNFVDITSKDCDAGGLVGNAAAIALEYNHNGGKITAQNGAAGGLVGYVGNKDTDPSVFVQNCSNGGAVIGYNCAGGICGHVESDDTGAVFSDNGNTGDITVTAKHSAGGIVGRTCTGGVFSNNKNSGNIENKSTNEDAEAGGILGENEDDAITITGNENTGNVTANKRAGGIAGTLGNRDHDKVCDVNNNSNSGNITSVAKDAAGIIGAINTDNKSHKIVNNTNTGIIEAKKHSGGIVGWMAGGGLFDSNTNSANITSIDSNAGGIVGGIQDDKCNFRKSSLGNVYPGVGSLTPGELAGCDYYINALNADQHAGIICGWDGYRKEVINNDSLLATIFGQGNIVIIIALVIILVAAATVVVVVYRKRKKKEKETQILPET